MFKTGSNKELFESDLAASLVNQWAHDQYREMLRFPSVLYSMLENVRDFSGLDLRNTDLTKCVYWFS